MTATQVSLNDTRKLLSQLTFQDVQIRRSRVNQNKPLAELEVTAGPSCPVHPFNAGRRDTTGPLWNYQQLHRDYRFGWEKIDVNITKIELSKFNSESIQLANRIIQFYLLPYFYVTEFLNQHTKSDWVTFAGISSFRACWKHGIKCSIIRPSPATRVSTWPTSSLPTSPSASSTPRDTGRFRHKSCLKRGRCWKPVSVKPRTSFTRYCTDYCSIFYSNGSIGFTLKINRFYIVQQ